MDLILTERGRTHIAYLNGEEWTDYGTRESSLDKLRDFLIQAKKRESQQITIRDGDTVAIDFVGGAGIVLSQILVDHNPSDHKKLISELRKI